MTTGMTMNIVWYFFLAGAGCGTYLISIAFKAPGKPELKAIITSHLPTIATIIAAALVLAGSAFLYIDLGVPSLFTLVFNMLGTSIISFGSLSICLFLGFCALRILIQVYASGRLARVAGIICSWGAAIFAFTTATYTGYFLFTMKSIPFWDTPLVIALFIASSLSSGTACLLVTLVLGSFAGKTSAIRYGCRADTILLTIEVIFLAAFLASRIAAGGSAEEVALGLLCGPSCIAFWIGIVLVGIVLPITLEQVAVRQRNEACVLLAAASSLVGGMLLRWSIILI